MTDSKDKNVETFQSPIELFNLFNLYAIADNTYDSSIEHFFGLLSYRFIISMPTKFHIDSLFQKQIRYDSKIADTIEVRRKSV